MKQKNQEKGMALLVVLVIVTMLTALLTELAFSTMVDMRLVETFRDSTRAYYLAKGGVNAGRMILQDDQNIYDAFDEAWSQGVTNYPVGEGAVSVQIADLNGRLAINAMVKGDTPQTAMVDRCYRLLSTIELNSQADPAELTAALIDWLDTGNEPYDTILTDGAEIPVYGAEQSYYQGLADPYQIKNGPLETIDELALVKGFTPEIMAQIRPFVSVYDDKSINVNTAAAEILMSLAPEIDMTTAEQIVEFRNETPVKNIVQLENILEPLQYSALKTLANLKSLGTRSRFFRIDSDAVVNDGRRRLVAVVDKDDNSLIFFKVN